MQQNDIGIILKDKSLKAKARVEVISTLLLHKNVTINELISIAKDADEKVKGTCIESLEFATRNQPGIATSDLLNYITETLTDNSPRVRWESAKVIAIIAHLFPTRLHNAINNLLSNTKYPGTVVRWSAALALGEIVKLKTRHNKNLFPAIEAIIKREEDNAIKKIYQKALKK